MKNAMTGRWMLLLLFVLSVEKAFALTADPVKLENLKNKDAGVFVRELFVFRNANPYHAKAISRDGTQLSISDAHKLGNVNATDAKIKELVDRIALEVNSIKAAEDAKAATESVGKIEALLPEYKAAVKASDLDVVTTYGSLLWRLAAASTAPAVQSMLRAKLAALVKKQKNGELEFLEEEEEFFVLYPDWLQSPPVGICQPPESFWAATQQADEKTLEAMRRSSFVQFKAMMHSAYGIVKTVYMLSMSATTAEARKHVSSLDKKFASHEKLLTANFGKYSFTSDEKLERRINCAKGYLNLLDMASAHAGVVVKPTIDKQLEKQRKVVDSLEKPRTKAARN